MKIDITVIGNVPDNDLISPEDLVECSAGVYASDSYENYYVVIFPNGGVTPSEAIVEVNMVGHEVRCFDPKEWKPGECFYRIDARVSINIEVIEVEAPEDALFNVPSTDDKPSTDDEL